MGAEPIIAAPDATGYDRMAMGVDHASAEADPESRAEQAYTWTVRIVYLALVVGNLALIYDTWKDSPAGIEWTARFRRRWQQLQDCEGCARRREMLRRARGRMMWDAVQTVEHGPEWDQQRGASEQHLGD